MYSVPQSEQLSIFVAALGTGFILGIVYDILRAIRLSFTSSKAAVVIFDLLYCFIFWLGSFLFIIALNKGELRFYIVAGEIIGALFYYVSFGIAAIKLTDVFVKFLKRFYSFIFRIISAPFRLLKRVLNHLKTKLLSHRKKSEKNMEKLEKKLLPKLRMYVYNLSGMFFISKNSEKKGGGSFGKENKTSKKEK